MMSPEQDTETAAHGSPSTTNQEEEQQRTKQPQQITRNGKAGNGDEQEEQQHGRGRRQSDAQRRDEREQQRTANHENKSRLSILNNRFLTRKESRAGSSASAASAQSPRRLSPRRTPTKKKKKSQQPQEDGDEGDEEEANQATNQQIDGATVESALVVTRKKPLAAPAATTPKTNAAKAATRQPIIVVPSAHMFPSLALHRSKWTRELDDDATCGLFVAHEQRELAQVASSTLVRLEERLQREGLVETKTEQEKDPTAHSIRLNDLLHLPQPQQEDNELEAGVVRDADVMSKRHHGGHQRRGAAWTTALLEVVIDRIVLDDHVSFSLADRIETQMRSLYASYTQLLHAQPWRVHLQRIDAFVDAQLLAKTATTTTTTTTTAEQIKWRRQTRQETQDLLQSLSGLQQLHYQLIAKWQELQDCYRQPALLGRTGRLRVDQERRAASISLATVRAFLEMPYDKKSDDGEEPDPITSKLTKRLDELEIKDQFLHAVVKLTALAIDICQPHTNQPISAPTPAEWMGPSSWHWPTKPSLPPPKFYAVLLINNKQVGRTRTTTWAAMTTSSHNSQSSSTVGVVVFHETLSTQLQFFPDSVTIQIYECGLLVDTLLSTSAIPMLIPGYDLIHSTTNSTGTTGSTGGASKFHSQLHDQTSRVAAASLAPSREWYQFSSVRAMARSKWHATFLNSSLFTNFQRHPHGRVRVQVSWVAPPSLPHASSSRGSREQDDEEESRTTSAAVDVWLPQQRVAAAAVGGNAKLIGPRVDRRPHGQERHTSFSYERDFLVHVVDDEPTSSTSSAVLVVDRMDPQNASVVRLQDHVRAQSALLRQRDVFRTTALAYDGSLVATPWASGSRRSASDGSRSSALTNRNYLLQLRDRHHVATRSGYSHNHHQSHTRHSLAAFDDPLPLSEHEIATNAKFLSLLRPEIKSFDHQERLDDALAAGERFSTERQRKIQLLKLQDFVDRVKASQVAASLLSPATTSASASGAGGANKERRTKTLASIIQEQPLPLLPGALDLSGLGNLFSRRRRLRPHVEKRTAPQTMAEWPRQCTLYVQVKSAANVPVRVAAITTAASKKTKPPPTKGGSTPQESDDDDDPQSRRSLNQNRQQSSEPSANSSKSSNVFVEISFQGRRRRTTSTYVRGTSGAVWMETLALPFHAPLNDWSPASIQRSQDVIYLSLFDQLVHTSNGQDDNDDALLSLDRKSSGAGGGGAEMGQQQQQQQRIQSFHQENRFLGSLEIPFTTLYHNHGTLDATLRCEMPVANVGYANAKSISGGGDQSDDQPATATAGAGAAATSGLDRDDDGVLQSSRQATFLSVMMTLDPLLALPVPTYDDTTILTSSTGNGDGDNTSLLASYARQWAATTKQLNAATKQRDFHVFVRNLSHGQTFLTRYLTPQPPPPVPGASGSSSATWTVPQLVRFVQLIPFLDDWHLFGNQGDMDVWTTSQELLDLNAGDFEEHAVLLCNYLQYVDRLDANRRSFLVLATAVPEGKTVYVLRQDTYKIPQRSVLWNASTGVGYSVLDDRCPVLDISLVVSSDNIYANIQPSKKLSEMNWDVETNTKSWKPFFRSGFKKDQFHAAAAGSGGSGNAGGGLHTVQLRELTYVATPPEYVQQVEAEVKEAIKLEIRRWRSAKFTTTFNMELSMKLRAQLERLESSKSGQQQQQQQQKIKKNEKSEDDDPIHKLLQMRKRVSGMPLHTSFTDVNKVLAMVKNTNIYWNDHEEVEFGLAVFVHAYPNYVLSLWVYLVAVEPPHE